MDPICQTELDEKAIQRSLRFRKAFSYLRTPIIRLFYNRLAKITAHEDIRFLNYGYDYSEAFPELTFDDPLETFSLALYYQAVEGIHLTDKTVVEVGSGRGGGADYLVKTFQPKSMVGIDLSEAAVALANQNYSNDRLRFLEGSADDLPVPDNSVDVVINVESSHCYGDLQAFYDEVYRVLKPGGLFAYTDFRFRRTVPQLAYILKQSPLKVVTYRDITQQVVSALDKDSERRLDLIHKYAKKKGEIKRISDFAAVKGTPIYNSFASGKRVYFRMLLQKPAANG